VCPRPLRSRAGWVRLRASLARSPGGAPRDLLTEVHALPCYPPPSVENACRSKLRRAVQWGLVRIRLVAAAGTQIQRGVRRAVSTPRGLLLPGVFDAHRNAGAPRAAGLSGRTGDELALVDCACPSR
jgi:hypothetical protein